MKRFILRRVGYALLSLVVLSATIFVFVRLTGDPSVLLVEPGASKADMDAIRADLGLDRPLLVQYALFVKGLLKADFGRSFYYRTPVLELYLDRLPNSLLLAVVAMAFSLVIGIPSGILAAMRVNSGWDGAGKVFALLGLSMPSFWVGLLMILFFSVYLGWLPSSGSGTPLRLKGLPETLVICKHAFKNALIPVLTLAGINLVLMINVAVVVETVFAWPGVGRLFYEGIAFRDFPIVQTSIILSGTMIVAVNLAVDLLYAVIDPRIRYER